VAGPRVLPAEATARKSPLEIFSALRHRNYRIYWFGMLVAVIGMQVQFVAQTWLLYVIGGALCAGLFVFRD